MAASQADPKTFLKELIEVLNVFPIPMGIALDPECNTVHINQAFSKLLNEPSGRTASSNASLDEEPVAENCVRRGAELLGAELPMKVAATTGQEVHDAQVEVIDIEGATHHLLGSAAPIFDRQRTVRGSIGVFLDITERLRMETEAKSTRIAYERAQHVAHTLQKALLPNSLPQVAGLTFNAVYEPAASDADVGGDWYDAFHLSDGRVLITIGDVAGRGLPAAVAMAKMRLAIRLLALQQPDPALILNAADMLLRLESPDTMVTAIVGFIDPIHEKFTVAAAGHPPGFIKLPDKTIVELPGGGLPLSLRKNDEPPAKTVDLPRGSLLVLYTDGLTEATRDVLEGERRLKAAMLDEAVLQSSNPAKAIQNSVLGDGHHDDVAILTIDVHPALGKPLILELPALPISAKIVRQALRALSADLRLSADRQFALQVAVGEALMNVVEHAYGAQKGPVRLEVTADSRNIMVDIEDHGKWRAPRDDGRGWGLPIMRELCESVETETVDGKSTVHLTLAVTDG